MQRHAYELAPPGPDAAPLFLRMPTVLRLTGLGRSTIYRLIADHKFPCPVRLGPRAVAWRRADLERWSAGALERGSSADTALMLVRQSDCRDGVTTIASRSSSRGAVWLGPASQRHES